MKSPNVPNMIVKKHQTLVPQIDQPTLYHLTLEPGNKIILGSDGLWDNIFFKDIKKILIDNSQSDIARDILIEKVDDVLYQNPTQRTPWSESRKFQKMNTQDGPKIDDTTFLVIQTS
jgi:serine/threonine protein phosphatase PrpC